jgi:hypothetical protein
MIQQMTGIQYAALPHAVHACHPPSTILPALRRYTLEHAQEQAATPTSSARTLYVIQKARRTATTSKVEAVRLYHVLDGVVYEVPSLQAVLSARLARLGWLLGSAFSAIQDVTSPDAAAALQARSVSAADAATRCGTSGTSDGAATQQKTAVGLTRRGGGAVADASACWPGPTSHLVSEQKSEAASADEAPDAKEIF